MRSFVGAFCPGCLRDFFEVLPEVLAEDLPEGFAADFLLDVTSECCPFVRAVGELLLGFFFAAALCAAFAWPKLAGTPSPAKELVSRTKSAGRIIFMGFDFPLSCFIEPCLQQARRPAETPSKYGHSLAGEEP